MDSKYKIGFSSQKEKEKFIKKLAKKFKNQADQKENYWNSTKFSQQITLLQNYINNKHPAESIDELFSEEEFSKMCNTVFNFCESKPYKESHISAEYKGLLFIGYKTPGFVYNVKKAE